MIHPSFISSMATGEFVLKLMPNGGSAIILRTFWVSGILFLIAISISEITCENTQIPFEFSRSEFKNAIHNHLDWLGALIGFSYLALYSRFSSQWSYLADLYNRIMQSRAENSESLLIQKINGTYTLNHCDKVYAYWMAAFIEDAKTLHLAKHKSFIEVIDSMKKLPGVEAALKTKPQQPDYFKGA